MDHNEYRMLHKEEYRKYQERYRSRHGDTIRQYRKFYTINVQSPRTRKLYRDDPAYREYRKASSQRRYYDKRIRETESLIDQGEHTPAIIESLVIYKIRRRYYRDIELNYKLNKISHSS